MRVDGGRVDGGNGAAATRRAPSFDAESLFGVALSAEGLLDRADEAVLARGIVAARQRIRAQLKRARRLVRAALAQAGRGVVGPERDFREREALVILRFAEAALDTDARARATGMTAAGLRAFIAALGAALADYRALRDRMLRANLRLVAAMARRHRHPTLTYLDLVQEGTFGLLRAVEKYEPARGVRFSTYATWWISQQLARTADTQGALIRTPVHWNQLRRRVARARAGDQPAARWAATQDADELRFATMTQAWHFISTDAAEEGDDRNLAAVLASAVPDPEAIALQASLGHRLGTAVADLPARERRIVRQRLGLDSGVPRTLEELSVEFGVSRERVRQLESRALTRLRAICTEQGLRDYLN